MSETIFTEQLLIELDRSIRDAAECNTRITKSDISITNKLLKAYPSMNKVVLDYEATGAHLLLQINPSGPKSLLAYAASKSEGAREYKACKVVTEFIYELINSLYFPYERIAMQKRYIEGEKDRVASEWLQDERKSGLPAIQDTTYYEHKRRGLRRVARSLKIIGIINLIPEGIIKLGMEVNQLPE